MQKRLLLNLVLLVVVAVLVLLAIYEPGLEKEDPPRTTLTPLEVAAVSRIVLERTQGGDIVIEREGDHWQMREPIDARVSEYRASALLRLPAAESLDHFSITGRNPAHYGLDQPSVSVTYNNSTRIAFGSNTPLDYRRYVQAGDEVHLITDSHYYQLIGGFTTFLDTRPLAGEGQLSELKLPGLRLHRQEGKWAMEPAQEGVTADQMAALVNNWRNAGAMEVKPYDGNSGEALTITPVEGTPLAFLVTAREPELVLARPALGIQYHFDAGQAANLLQPSRAGE